MTNIYSLDIETEAINSSLPYALEPFRLKQNKAKITCVSIAGHNGYFKLVEDMRELPALLKSIRNCEVYAHNALFDIAWLIAEVGLDIVSSIRWRDTMLLDKWLTNSNGGNEHKSRALVSLVKEYLSDHPLFKEFYAVKAVIVNDHSYWKRRNELDTILTLELAKILSAKLPDRMRRGFLIEQACLLPFASSWLHGIEVDSNKVDTLTEQYEQSIDKQITELGITQNMLRSPKQLGELLFNRWELPVNEVSEKTGLPSTSADNLAVIYQKTQDPRLAQIRSVKTDMTIMSKYLNGFRNCRDYVGTDTIYGCPRLFSTKTGRLTYSSKTQKKHQVSISLHQLPRRASGVKDCLSAGEGNGVIYIDAAAQELRWIAQIANEKAMLNNFNNGVDLHSYLTERIFGIPYDDIVEANRTGSPKKYVEYRDAGKLTGLSAQYRMGSKSLANKFLTRYGEVISQQTAHQYLTSYKKTYKYLVKYWYSSILLARRNRYAETIGSRRLYIDKLNYPGEQDSINFPIQGSGADHTLAILAVITKRFPELRLLCQVHDSLTFACSLEIIEEISKILLEYVNNYDIGALWGKPLRLEFPWEGLYGTSFKELISI